MSLLPLNSKTEQKQWYGDPSEEETKLLLTTSDDDVTSVDVSTAEVIYEMFVLQESNWNDLYAHPMTNPKLAPEKRFKRHRNYYIYQLNQFRHWWKTSRLLVRLSGGYEYCLSQVNWVVMATYKVSKHRQAKKALKSVKAIGRGGPSRDFLKNVKVFTRTIRIILAVARGLEAKVDNRFVEVLLAEGL